MINRVKEYLPERPSAGEPGGPFSLSKLNVQQWIEPVEELIVKYPAATLASAFVVGVAIAWWIKRK